MLSRHELPEEMVSLSLCLFTEVLDGRNSRVADGVQHALRRTFSDYARAAASAGAWAA